MLHVQTFTHEPFRVHSHLVWDDETAKAVLIDVGRDYQAIVDFVCEHELALEDVFHTHGFLEFLEGQPELRDELDIVAHMNPLDEFWLAHLHTQATILNVESVPLAFIDQQVLPGDVFDYGSFEVQAIETPGNSPGGLSYYVPQAQAVFVGDVLYAGRIGPTDIPHGNTDLLVRMIRERIFTLPDETTIYPGRGPATTVAHEKRFNSLETRPYAIKPSDEWD